MSIPDHARANFQTLLRAAADGNLALLESPTRRLALGAMSSAPSAGTARNSSSRRSGISPRATPTTPMFHRRRRRRERERQAGTSLSRFGPRESAGRLVPFPLPLS